MRSFLPAYELKAASSLDEALRLLADEPGTWQPFAGGTDLMVLLEAGKLTHTRFVSLWGLPELRGIEAAAHRVTVRALTTYTDVLESDVLRTAFPLLGEAAARTGGVATQNRGTIAGNIANASPAADTPPALLAYDAEIELASLRGRRRVPYHAFHREYKSMDMRPDELIVAVHLPRRRWTCQTFRKVGTRRAQAISKVCFAGTAEVRDGVVSDVRLAFGSVAPTPIRAVRAEAAVRGSHLERDRVEAARAALRGDIAPIDDMRSTAAYRANVAANLLEQFLEGCRGI